MNKRNLIFSISTTILLFIIALLLGIFTFKNGFNISEMKASNLFSFLGGMLGTLVSIAGSFVVLLITIKKNNEHQVKLINEQNSIQVENNLQQRYNKERENFNNAYNSIEQLLITSKTYMVDESSTTYINVIDRLNLVYTEYRKCINSVLITTNVYTLQEKCVGCTLCDIKSYGELSRVLKDIQSIIKEIEHSTSEINLKQNILFDIAFKNKQLVDNKELLVRKISVYKKEQKEYPKTSKDFIDLEKEVSNMNQQLINTDNNICANLRSMKDENKNLFILINNLETMKLNFFNKIKEYFEIVKFHISEQVQFVKNNGRTSSTKCRKYELETSNSIIKKPNQNNKKSLF